MVNLSCSLLKDINNYLLHLSFSTLKVFAFASDLVISTTRV